MIRKSLMAAITILTASIIITTPIQAAKTTSSYTMSAKVTSISNNIISFTDSRREVWEWELDEDENPDDYKINRKCTLTFYDCNTKSIYDDEITKITF